MQFLANPDTLRADTKGRGPDEEIGVKKREAKGDTATRDASKLRNCDYICRAYNAGAKCKRGKRRLNKTPGLRPLNLSKLALKNV